MMDVFKKTVPSELGESLNPGARASGADICINSPPFTGFVSVLGSEAMALVSSVVVAWAINADMYSG